MRKNLVSIILFFLCAGAFSESSDFVKITQFIEGRTVGSFVEKKFALLQVGTKRIRYVFSANADDEKSFVKCRFEFPKKCKVEILQHSGVQTVDFNGGKLPVVSLRNDGFWSDLFVCELLIPQKKDADCWIDFLVDFPKKLRKKSMLVDAQIEKYSIPDGRKTLSEIADEAKNDAILNYNLRKQVMLRSIMQSNDTEGLKNAAFANVATSSMSNADLAAAVCDGVFTALAEKYSRHKCDSAHFVWTVE